MSDGREGMLSDALTRRRFMRGGALTLGSLTLPGLLAACGSGDGSATTSAAGTQTGPIRRGGHVRLGVNGGGSSETLDPTRVAVPADSARAYQVFEPLVWLDSKGELRNVLAEEITPNADGTEWTIRLVPDVQWHDGKPLTADDVIYTFRYSLKHESFATAGYRGIDPNGLKKVDPLTLKVRVTQPNFLLPEQISGGYSVVIQDGVESFDKPVGTGPYRFVSWNRGERALFNRFDDYRISGQPYLDSIEIVSLNDPSARNNALQSGQVDIITEVPIPTIEQLKQNANLQVIETPGATWPGIYMFTSGPTAGPLGDVKVRQAMRLLINRQQVVDNVYQGHATLGNDIPTVTDPTYPRDMPQHEYDPDKARALLKEAGHEGLRMRLATADVYSGILDTTTLLAADAKKAGVAIELDKVPAGEYFDTTWNKDDQPFGVTYWNGRTAYGFAVEALLRGAAQPETRWNNAKYDQLWADILKNPDPQQRSEWMSETQTMIGEDGGYIIPAFPNYINAAATKVKNLPASPIVTFDHWDFRTVSVDEA